MIAQVRNALVALLALAALGLSPADQARLQAAVNSLQTQGVVTTPDLLGRLVQRPVVGARTNAVVLAVPIKRLQDQYRSLLEKYELSASASASEVKAALAAAVTAGRNDSDPVKATNLIADYQDIVLLQQALAPDAPTAITNMVVEPVYGEPLWTGPEIRGEDVEAVQRLPR